MISAFGLYSVPSNTTMKDEAHDLPITSANAIGGG